MKGNPIINHDKCSLCGRCVKECVRNILSIVEKRISIIEDDCMLCAHCYSICPENAISFDTNLLKPVEFTFPYTEDYLSSSDIDATSLINLIRSRRSIRKYRKKPVQRKLLNDLISCAVTAPSASNYQVWEFSILNSRESVFNLAQQIGGYLERFNRMARNPVIRILSLIFVGKELINYYRDRLERVEFALSEARKGIDLLFWGAPALIIVHSCMDASMPVEDAQYASYNITLLAHALGLGTCFIGYATAVLNRSKKIKDSLGIPKRNRIHAVLTVGYPDIQYERLPLRKPIVAHWK